MSKVVLDRRQVAAALEEIGTLLELKGENPFKARAYATAARTLEALSEDFGALVAGNRMTDLKGIGEVLAEKIVTLATTGALPYLDELRAAVPHGLLEMIRIPGLGPKRAKALHDALGVETVDALQRACEDGRLASLPGFGARTQQSILEGIAFLKRNVGRMLIDEATTAAEALLEILRGVKGVARAEHAGSLRRRRETIGDIDLLAARRKGVSAEDVIEAFVRGSGARRVLGAGETKASVILESGRQVDLRVVTEQEYPFALHYFTGSAEHNIAIRKRAQSMGLKINEYGLWKGKRRLACRGEVEIFKRLGLAWIPPELREDWGEIEAAEKGELPDLITQDSIRGVLHVHSTWSDGTDSLESMIRGAAALGYEYVGISEHSRSAGYANGLSIERVRRQRAEIVTLRKKYSSIRILHGTESDILKDGALDYPSELLDELDFVVGSVHSSFTLSESEQTERCVRAMANPHLTILGHPTGRLLLQREAFRIDLARVIQAAAKHGKSIELNANPHRLDLDWRGCRLARDSGVGISINPDAHSVDGLGDVRYGVDTGRRGWLRTSDVLNARPWTDVRRRMGSRA